MKVVVSAGGTGGHIYPALAIINKLKDNDKNCEILYIGTTDRMESSLIPNLGIKYVGIEMLGIDRKNILKNVIVLNKYLSAKKKIKEILTKFNPDIVIGAGGYITAPVLTVAHNLGFKTLIHEQNILPGITNKKLSKIVDKVCISLPDSIKYFDQEKTVYTGNPRSEEIIRVKPSKKSEYGLDDKKKLVIIVMGSLGSTTMTKKIKQLLPAFNEKEYQVMIVTGKKYYDCYSDIKLPKNVIKVPFLENFINILKSADLIISRAGASTIAEVTAIGLPAILVPSPYVTNNHQYKNAKALEKVGACKVITEDEFNTDKILNGIDDIFIEKNYFNMKNSSKKLGVVDSASRVYNEIKKLVKEDI